MRTRSTFILVGAMAVSTMLAAVEVAADDIVERDRHLFQRPAPSITRVRDLQPVEQTIEDIGPLAKSIRHMHTGLRQPSGFEDVFRVPGDDDLFVRVDGGLYAVFPRSVYASTESGELPMIPANTVFWIGMPDFLKRTDRVMRNEAAQEMRRLFVMQPETMLVPTRMIGDGSFAERLRVVDASRSPSAVQLLRLRQETRETRETREGRGGRGGRADSLPQRDMRHLTNSRDRLPVPDNSETEALWTQTAAQPGSEHEAECDQFRRRMHDLLRRAAEHELNGRSGS